jgi:hypothetical protein
MLELLESINPDHWTNPVIEANIQWVMRSNPNVAVNIRRAYLLE